MSTVSIVHNSDQSRYEVHVDGRVAGYTRYVRRPHALDFIHTEIDPEFEGQGLGSKLAAGALDDVRAGGGRVIASCPFISAYIKHHREYADLLVSSSSGAR